MRYNIYEILEEFKLAEDDDERVDILKRHETQTLREILTLVLNETIPVVKLDYDDLPYRPQEVPPGLSVSNMDVEFRMIYLFIEGHPKASPNLSNARREEILVQIMEALEPKEAEVYRNMLKKDLGVPSLTKEVVKQAFPDIPL